MSAAKLMFDQLNRCHRARLPNCQKPGMFPRRHVPSAPYPAHAVTCRHQLFDPSPREMGVGTAWVRNAPILQGRRRPHRKQADQEALLHAWFNVWLGFLRLRRDVLPAANVSHHPTVRLLYFNVSQPVSRR